MGHYLSQLDALPPAARWAQARKWLFGEPLPFFAELRAERPILVLPELTLATRYADCDMILRRHETFQVDLYKPKQGDYWMAQDETPVHIREKSIMRALLDREEVPQMRAFIANAAAARMTLGAATKSLEIVHGVCRSVPLSLVQDWFGFEDSDPQSLFEWSYWSQQDAFHNQPFDHRPDAAAVIDKREKAGVMLGLYLAKLVAKKTAEVKLGGGGDRPVARLLRLYFSDATKLGFPAVLFNVGGLLIGAVETTSHCAVNALTEIFARPDVLARARVAAMDPDPAKFDGYAFEALRFRPAFPYYFRTCHAPTVLAAGTPHATTIPAGATVLAVTHSAMHDDTMFVAPDMFDPGRAMGDTFTFGQGLHECLGKAIGEVLVAETVRQVLRVPGIHPAGPVQWQGDVPEHWTLQW